VWEPEAVAVNIADALDPVRETPEDRTTRRDCQAWLRKHLADGPHHSIEVEQAAKAAGFKQRTIDRAKSGLVDSVKCGLGGWDWIITPRPRGVKTAMKGATSPMWRPWRPSKGATP
jgi:hypothetical protein